MAYHPAGYSSDEDEFDTFDFGDDTPKRCFAFQQPALTPDDHLFDAVGNNDVAAATSALIAGADIHCRRESSKDYSPIMKAAVRGSYDVMELLLERGANVHDDLRMYNVLMCLCDSYIPDEEGLCKCLDLLLKNGADLLSTDRAGVTPLMYAVKNNRQRLVAKLLEAGSSVNTADGQGWTAIFHSVNKGFLSMTKFLIDAGADMNRLDRYGGSLVDLAASKEPELQALIGPVTEDVPTENSTPVRVGQFKLAMTEAPKVEDRLYGFNEDAVRFVSGIGLDHVANVVEKKNVQFSELMTWSDGDWGEIGISLSYHLRKLKFCVNNYHEKEWGPGGIPKTNDVVSDDLVDLFAVVQFLLSTLRNSHITSTTSLYMVKNYDGSMTPESAQELRQVLETAEIIKNQLAILKTISKELDASSNMCPPDLIDRTNLKKKIFSCKRFIYCGVAFAFLYKLRPITGTVVDLCSKLAMKIDLSRR